VLVDMPLEKLREFRYARPEPPAFEAFWRSTLAAQCAEPVRVLAEPVDTILTGIEVRDVTFGGYAGDPVRAWYLRPAGTGADLPTVVEFIGYGGGRGLPHESLLWASCGYAHLVVDTRGQGGQFNAGDTADPHGSGPSTAGFVTRGLDAPENHYYTRVFIDAVRAVAAARALPGVDGERLITFGGSQGGAIALAAASLTGDVAGVAARAPFLCAIERAAQITDTGPFRELGRWLAVHHGERAQTALETLAYIDVVFHARRARCPAYISVGLMDDICPPSTVMAAANDYGGEVSTRVWPWNGHEVGASQDLLEIVRWAGSVLSPATNASDPPPR
jgi:cephalosporin-C deacetylase